MRKLTVAFVGASYSFFPGCFADLVLSEKLATVGVVVRLMDIDPSALDAPASYARRLIERTGRDVAVTATTDLREAVAGADCVVTAIEVDRYRYWSQDFHIPRRYGFRQIYGENGGPGGIFHALRNLGPMLEIARAVEELCPDAWILNFTNPEAKLVEAITRMTSVKILGLCHGFAMSHPVVSAFLGVPEDEIEFKGGGLNHFGFLTEIREKATARDLYPLLREREAAAQWLYRWDELALLRIIFRTYGLWPYPGTNHTGEYIAWAEEFLASSRVQYFHDPVVGLPWDSGQQPTFVYSFEQLTDLPETQAVSRDPFTPSENENEDARFSADGEIAGSGEVLIDIIESVFLGQRRMIKSVNMPNQGAIPGLPDETVVEAPAVSDGAGVRLEPLGNLPEAILGMMRTQASIHQLITEAYVEGSRRKLLQAVLADPTVSTYGNAVAMINDMCELQRQILPPMKW